MIKNNWSKYYSNYRFSLSNILLHTSYILKIILSRPKTILEIGCGPADHSMFIKKILKNTRVSLLDIEKPLLKRNKTIYGKKISNMYNFSVLDKKNIRKLPKFDIVMSQGLMEHFDDGDFLKIIDNFSYVSKKMIFSVPSDVYKNKDFGNEILRSRQTMLSLLQNNISFKFKVNNYFDLGIRTKIQLIRQDKLNLIESLSLIFLKSCHLLVEIYYK